MHIDFLANINLNFRSNIIDELQPDAAAVMCV